MTAGAGRAGKDKVLWRIVRITALVGVLTACAAAPPRPRLVVLLSIDQMRADYVDRFRQDWTGGLERLASDGARFSRAAYPYLNTVTCVGHSTMSTGTLPYHHGMVLNGWWDRDAGRQVTCTGDPDERLVPYLAGAAAAGEGNSLRRLERPTFADELRSQLATPTHVVGLSLKARSAMTLAGRRADVVAWLDDAAGWVTSSAYGTTPAPFLARFFEANPIAADRGRTWTPMLPEAAYLFPDDGVGERPPAGWTRTFPHPLADGAATSAADFEDRWTASPWSDEYLERAAEQAVEQLNLGRGPGTDFLGIGFSALDYVGHAFGPRSQEVQDTLARLDRTLGRFFALLDRRVGRDQYVVALTSDHGVAPLPEQQVEAGLDAGRIDLKGLAARVEDVLAGGLGAGRHVAALLYTDLYFTSGTLASIDARPGLMEKVLETIASWPGIAAAYPGRDLRTPAAHLDPDRRPAALSYFPGRSGDVVIVPKIYWIATGNGTTHGTAAAYDQRIPVILMGPSFRRGEYLGAASPADIVPTLAHVTGVTMAQTDGRVLTEALLIPEP